MADARLPDRWMLDRRIRGLSDSGWRTFTSMLMWGAGQETDGLVLDDELRFMHGSSPEHDIPALLAAGLIKKVRGGFQLVGWESDLGQSTAASLQAGRDRKRQNQRAARARKKPSEPTAVTGDKSGDRGGDDNGDESGDLLRRGKDRKGQAASTGSVGSSPETTGWYTAPIPNALCPTHATPTHEGFCARCEAGDES